MTEPGQAVCHRPFPTNSLSAWRWTLSEIDHAIARLRRRMAVRLAAHGRYVGEHRVDPPWASYREVLESAPLALQV